MPGQVYVVDDQPEVVALLTELLRNHGRETQGFADGERLLERLGGAATGVDLVVLDLDLGPGKRSGLQILEELRGRFPHLPVVMLTGKGTVETAVQAMRLGATDFIEKDPRLSERVTLQLAKLDQLLAVIRDNQALKRQNQWLMERAGFPLAMVGIRRGLLGVFEKIQALASIPRPVLIRGERGTGKELVAWALHESGDRRRGPFITTNCAALSETLAEAELFGHERGAFTDAREAKAGRFELADGGTLFLDEIGNMAPAIQQKILRVIEYQSFERVRGTAPIRVNVRICAATNANLEAEMAAGRFRRDLFDRLAFDTIEVPPLRERPEDLPELCAHFLARFRSEVGEIRSTEVSAAAIERLRNYPFPGNVRELKNLIERAAYRCKADSIRPEDLNLEPAAGPVKGAPGSWGERVADYERQLLQDALDHAGHNLAQAARALGLGYDQIRRLVKKHGLRHK